MLLKNVLTRAIAEFRNVQESRRESEQETRGTRNPGDVQENADPTVHNEPKPQDHRRAIHLSDYDPARQPPLTEGRIGSLRALRSLPSGVRRMISSRIPSSKGGSVDIARFAGAIISLGCYGVAVAQLHLEQNARQIPHLYSRSFWVLFVVSAVLTLLQGMLRTQWTARSIILARICVLLVLLYPLSSAFGLEAILGIGLLVEVVAAESVWEGIITGIFVIFLLVVISQGSADFLGRVVTTGSRSGAGDIGDTVSLGTSLAFVLLLAELSKRSVAWALSRHASLERLQFSLVRLSSANHNIQEFATAAEEIARTKERERITREVHDSAGYFYTNILSLVEVAISMTPASEVPLARILTRARDQAREGLAETRRSLRTLRTVVTNGSGDTKHLMNLISTFHRATGVNVHAELGNSRPTYGQVVDHVIYRIVQEGLTNALLHGRATDVWIYLWDNDGTLKLYVQDNGKGSNKYTMGIGLTGMQERLADLGGNLTITAPSVGFRILAEIPVQNNGLEP